MNLLTYLFDIDDDDNDVHDAPEWWRRDTQYLLYRQRYCATSERL